jgi:hypothetical protein
MSMHLSKTPKLTRVLIALTTLLALTDCTVTSESDPVTDRRPATAAPDDVALENAIETKISQDRRAVSRRRGLGGQEDPPGRLG